MQAWDRATYQIQRRFRLIDLIEIFPPETRTKAFVVLVLRRSDSCSIFDSGHHSVRAILVFLFLLGAGFLGRKFSETLADLL